MRRDYKKIIEWLAFILRCPICGYRYSMEQTKLVDSRERRIAASADLLIHTDCERCKSSVIFSIAIDGPEIFSVGMVTDLTSTDTSKFKNTRTLNSNDVLAMHQFFKDFDGNFQSVLQ